MPLFLIETIQRDSVISFPALGLSLDPPAYFTLFGFRIYFYGVLIALGFLLAILYCARRAPEFGLKRSWMRGRIRRHGQADRKIFQLGTKRER